MECQKYRKESHKLRERCLQLTECLSTSKHGFGLKKQQFWNAVRFIYGWNIPKLPHRVVSKYELQEILSDGKPLGDQSEVGDASICVFKILYGGNVEGEEVHFLYLSLA